MEWLGHSKIVEKSKLYFIDIDSFIVYIKTKEIYVDIAKVVETKCDFSTYELDKPWPKRNRKKAFRLKKIELGRKIIMGLSHWDQKRIAI